MHTSHRLSAFLFLFTWLFLGLTPTPAASAEPGGATSSPEEVKQADLKPVSIKVTGRRTLRIDKSGNGSIPFTNQAKKLHYQYRDGRVFIDLDGDGDLSDEKTGFANKDMATLTVPFGDGTIDYQLQFEIRPKWKSPILVAVRTALQAQIDGHTFQIQDGNTNGRFDDSNTDCLTRENDRKRLRQKDLFVLDGKFVQAAVEETSLQFLTYRGPTCQVRAECKVPNGRLLVAFRHPESGLSLTVDSGSGNAVTAIPGKVLIQNIRVAPDASSTKNSVGLFVRGMAPLTLKEGDNVISAGPPFKLKFSAVRKSAHLPHATVTGLSLIGVAGESYLSNVYGKDGSKSASFLRSQGEDRKMADLKYG